MENSSSYKQVPSAEIQLPENFIKQFQYVMVFKLEEEVEADGKNRRASIIPDSLSAKKETKLVQSKVTKECINRMLEKDFRLYTYLSLQKDELIVLIRIDEKKLRAFAANKRTRLLCDKNVLRELLKPTKGHPDYSANKDFLDHYKIIETSITHDPTITPYEPTEHCYLPYIETPEEESINREPPLPKGLYKQTVLNSALLKSKEVLTPFTEKIRLQLVYDILQAPIRDGGCAIPLFTYLHEEKIDSLFPLHNKNAKDTLLPWAMAWKTMPWDLKIQKKWKEYFGEKITLYNVFIGHYTFWLWYPSFLGLAFQLVVWSTGPDFQHPVLNFYSPLITIWGVIMLKYWRRKEKTLAMEWGCVGYEDDQQERPGFKGVYMKSLIHGGPVTYFPEDSLKERIQFSIMCITFMICLVIGIVTSIYVLKWSMSGKVASTYTNLVASFLNTIQISVCNFLYQQGAVRLTDMENHRTDTTFEDALISKLFLFQFINSYSSFFYIAFIARYLDKPPEAKPEWVGQCGADTCMYPLALNLAIIFSSRFVLSNVTEFVVPYLNKRSRENKNIYNKVNKGEDYKKGCCEGDEYEAVNQLDITEPEENYFKCEYDVLLDSISNYADATVQYGFMTLFITALPIACFLSMINNYVRMRVNAYKLFNFYQRPIPKPCEDIGSWYSIFQLTTLIACISNAAITCFTSDNLNDVAKIVGKLWIFIGYQWILVSTQFIVAACIEDCPTKTFIQIERCKFIESKVIDHIPDYDEFGSDEYKELVYRMNAITQIDDEEDEEEAKKCCGCKGLSLKGKIIKKNDENEIEDYPTFEYPMDYIRGQSKDLTVPQTMTKKTVDKMRLAAKHE